MRLFPNAKVICCVRDVPWIVDSIERLVRKNRYLASRIFDHDPSGTVFSRADAVTGQGGLVGFAWHAIKQAYYSDEADRMLVVRYESLTTDPARVLAEIYAFTGLPSYAHDFDSPSPRAGRRGARSTLRIDLTRSRGSSGCGTSRSCRLHLQMSGH